MFYNFFLKAQNNSYNLHVFKSETSLKYLVRPYSLQPFFLKFQVLQVLENQQQLKFLEESMAMSTMKQIVLYKKLIHLLI